ncbi:hypothetical protein FRAAL3456 [Frankia alni ACN14a]|uniref:Uncharacterized protein n=1 Tax=Frankia alni (strain DSM 45986 / CECT 9034 / ACN14a) TaxID=326424 RepID=Q0RK59_FRAAA|nr:hypothetical protein FRAAL3456 [Frankia alni ACN14a]
MRTAGYRAAVLLDQVKMAARAAQMDSLASRNASGSRLLGHFRCSLVQGQVDQSSCESGHCTQRSPLRPIVTP